MKNTKNFASRWGFILASVGSAVGMANVWGFPNKLGSNGGGAFLLIYLLFVFIFSYVGLPAEFAMGRHAATGTLGAYEKAWSTRGKGAGKAGGLLGWLPLAGSLCIAFGYAVIVTYILKALVDSLVGTLMTADTASWFGTFSSTPYSVIPYHIIVVVAVALFGRAQHRKNQQDHDAAVFHHLPDPRGARGDAAGRKRGLPLHVHSALGGAQGPDDLDLGDGTGVLLPLRHGQRHDRVRRVPLEG